MHAICWADRGVQQFHPRHRCSDTSDSAAALPWTSPVTSETAVVLAQTWRWCYLRCDGRYDALDIARSLKQPQQQMLWCHLSPYGGVTTARALPQTSQCHLRYYCSHGGGVTSGVATLSGVCIPLLLGTWFNG